MEQTHKLNMLKKDLHTLQPGVIAVSGGLDSRFLSSLAKQWGLDFHTVFFAGPQISPREQQEARRFLQELGLPFSIISTDPGSLPELRHNPRLRCYFCKKYLFVRVRQLFRPEERPFILDGTNSSDLKQFRPGLQALQELGVHSPLARAGLTKTEIRTLACSYGLPNPQQPSRPCLLTRFAYGSSLNRPLLQLIGHLEDLLLEMGFENLRLRVLKNGQWILQLRPQDSHLWQDKQDTIEKIMQDRGIAHLSTFFTDRLSGFFDQAAPDKR